MSSSSDLIKCTQIPTNDQYIFLQLCYQIWYKKPWKMATIILSITDLHYTSCLLSVCVCARACTPLILLLTLLSITYISNLFYFQNESWILIPMINVVKVIQYLPCEDCFSSLWKNNLWLDFLSLAPAYGYCSTFIKASTRL